MGASWKPFLHCLSSLARSLVNSLHCHFFSLARCWAAYRRPPRYYELRYSVKFISRKGVRILWASPPFARFTSGPTAKFTLPHVHHLDADLTIRTEVGASSPQFRPPARKHPHPHRHPESILLFSPSLSSFLLTHPHQHMLFPRLLASLGAQCPTAATPVKCWPFRDVWCRSSKGQGAQQAFRHIVAPRSSEGGRRVPGHAVANALLSLEQS